MVHEDTYEIECDGRLMRCGAELRFLAMLLEHLPAGELREATEARRAVVAGFAAELVADVTRVALAVGGMSSGWEGGGTPRDGDAREVPESADGESSGAAGNVVPWSPAAGAESGRGA